MRLAHSADWHFGERQYGFRRREEDYYRAAEYIADRACALDCDNILLPGDLLDIPKPSAEAVLRLQTIVARFRACGMGVYGIDGNHDACDSHWLRVCGITPLGIEPVQIFNKTKTEALWIAGINAARSSVFKQQVLKLVEQDKRVDILLIHQAVSELCGFDTKDIMAADLAKQLSKISVRYVAMGDIHNRKEANFGGIWFVYPGSPELTATNEHVDKSFSLVEISETELRLRAELVPVRPRIEVVLKSQEDLDGLKSLLADHPDAMVHIWFTPETKELSKRADVIMSGTNYMYRILPLFSHKADGSIDAQTLLKQSYDRQGAVMNLRNSISAFFPDGHDAISLIERMLSAPDNVGSIIDNYLKEKEIKV